jgi:ribulose-phosphate 3-epimerase
MVITPAILPENYAVMHDALFSIEGASHRVQIDICDGVFGLEKTWLPYREDSLPHGFEYEFDLMVRDWRKYVLRVMELHPKRIVVHIDHFSERDVEELLEMFQRKNIHLGLCVNNDTDIDQFISDVRFISEHHEKTFVQVMGIKKIGAQGQPFDERCLDRILHIRFSLRSLPIQVDGAMNPETITKVRKAGANGVIVGSYIFNDQHPVRKIKELENSFS